MTYLQVKGTFISKKVGEHMLKYRNKIILFTSILAITISAFIYSATLKADTSMVDLGGTIRNVGNGWATLNNSAHVPLNIQKVTTDKDKVTIWHSVSAKKVVTFMVTPDETMVSQGYTVGISGGLDYSYIFIYDKNHNLVNPNDYKNSGGNIWIYGILQR